MKPAIDAIAATPANLRFSRSHSRISAIRLGEKWSTTATINRTVSAPVNQLGHASVTDKKRISNKAKAAQRAAVGPVNRPKMSRTACVGPSSPCCGVILGSWGVGVIDAIGHLRPGVQTRDRSYFLSGVMYWMQKVKMLVKALLVSAEISAW